MVGGTGEGGRPVVGWGGGICGVNGVGGERGYGVVYFG